MSKPFCAKTRVARCFAELFWSATNYTIYGALIVDTTLFSFLSSRSHVKYMTIWMCVCIGHHICIFLCRVLKRSRHRYGLHRKWCDFSTI